MLIKVYARREPTTDAVAIQHGLGQQNLANKDHLSDQQLLKRGLFGKLDVVIYRDKDLQKPFCRYPWHIKAPVVNRSRYVTVNCFKWELVWMPDFLPRTAPINQHGGC